MLGVGFHKIPMAVRIITMLTRRRGLDIIWIASGKCILYFHFYEV